MSDETAIRVVLGSMLLSWVIVIGLIALQPHRPRVPHTCIMALREQGIHVDLRGMPGCEKLQEEIEFQKMLSVLEIMMKPDDDR